MTSLNSIFHHLIIAATLILAISVQAFAQITSTYPNNSASYSTTLNDDLKAAVAAKAKQACGGTVVIQVTEVCPQCAKFKEQFGKCPDDFKTITIKPGCDVNVCLQYLEPNQHSACIVGNQAFVPCCVPGDNGLPKHGPSCLNPENMSCCNGEVCRWGCTGWQGKASGSQPTNSSAVCAKETTFSKAGLNPAGLPPCDCNKPGASPLAPSMCSANSKDPTPKDCERLFCVQNKCRIVADCTELSCCDKSEFCKNNIPACKDRKETKCEKVCSTDGSCMYDCKDGCCCPQNDAEQCSQDCTLSNPPVKVCTKAEAIE
jgi:hypothetical protein